MADHVWSSHTDYIENLCVIYSYLYHKHTHTSISMFFLSWDFSLITYQLLIGCDNIVPLLSQFIFPNLMCVTFRKMSQNPNFPNLTNNRQIPPIRIYVRFVSLVFPNHKDLFLSFHTTHWLTFIMAFLMHALDFKAKHVPHINPFTDKHTNLNVHFSWAGERDVSIFHHKSMWHTVLFTMCWNTSDSLNLT